MLAYSFRGLGQAEETPLSPRDRQGEDGDIGSVVVFVIIAFVIGAAFVKGLAT
jgi:hypothetical protein